MDNQILNETRIIECISGMIKLYQLAIQNTLTDQWKSIANYRIKPYNVMND